MGYEIPILCIIGRSNSGKTTLIERLIRELTHSGYRIATIKHAGHGFDLDTEGKDSWRHKQAGAHTVIVKSKTSLAMFSDAEDDTPLTALRDHYVRNADLILAEGWKNERFAKIAVIRERFGELPITQDGLLAVVSRVVHNLPVPTIDPDDIQTLTSLIKQRFPIGAVSPPVLQK